MQRARHTFFGMCDFLRSSLPFLSLCCCHLCWSCCHTGALLKTHSEYGSCLINVHSCHVTCIHHTTHRNTQTHADIYTPTLAVFPQLKICWIIESVLHSLLLDCPALVSPIKLHPCWNTPPNTLTLLLSQARVTQFSFQEGIYTFLTQKPSVTLTIFNFI